MRNILILLFLITQLSAQDFVAEGKLPSIPRDGFYRIALTPQATAFTSTSFNNLRIVDDSGKETPYILEEEVPVFSTPQFKEYTITEKKYQQGCCTKLVLTNPDKKSINNISLVIKNAETYKKATLLGSDDRQTWYALKEHFSLDVIDGGNQTFEVRILDFPLSNYPFLSITVDDSASAPLNFLKAGYYDINTVSGMYSRVPGIKFSVKENIKKKQTVVTIRLDTARLMDKLELTISGQPFYHRQATLYETGTRLNKKKKSEPYENYVQSVELTSTHASTVQLEGVKFQNLMLVIENNDNPPLQIDSVTALQLNRYATAWLKKGMAYKLKIGRAGMYAPVYDLGFFRDSIPNRPMILQPTGIRFISQSKPESSSSIFGNKQMIWVAIILVAIVLGYMSVKMIGEKADTEKH
jgi:hypothetical protein